jgi:hypothetical protein
MMDIIDIHIAASLQENVAESKVIGSHGRVIAPLVGILVTWTQSLGDEVPCSVIIK